MVWVKPMRFLFVLVFLCLTNSKLMAQDKTEAAIRLFTAAMPPYQQLQGGEVIGSGVDTIRCIFERIGIKPSIELIPNSRLIYSLNEGRAEGVFSLGKRANSQAILSDPIVIEQLYWFYNDKEVETSLNDSSHSVAVVRGSEAQYWLQQHGYTNTVEVTDVVQAIKMLAKDRVELILADLPLAYSASVKLGLEAPGKYQSFKQFSSLYLHFSNQFLNKQPHALSQFNRTIPFCNPMGFELSKPKRQKLRHIVGKLKRWLEDNHLITKVRHLMAGQPLKKMDEIKDLDKQWQEERNNEADFDQTLIAKVFESEVSRLASELKFNHIEIISEVIITDAQGLNIGISDIPSDYWQGDEDKFLHTVGRNSNDFFIDQVAYDPSSASFLSQVSYAIYSGDEIIGMVTLGLNIENTHFYEKGGLKESG
jgi:ABC-type amino acid transport substrate-binding protein